jgi:gamma-glutamylcyclotransferase (GGCT)/AIG2-like uncharacterized protein YtfP
MDGRSKQDVQRLPFFVYGTLLPGQPNAVLWRELAVNVEKAQMSNGRLHDMGGYPMLVEAGTESVKGQLITLAPDFYPVVMARLDLLEGFDPVRQNTIGYRRVVREVYVENGRTCPAWVYVGQLDLVNGRVLIPNGDWVTYIAQKNQAQTNQPPIRPPFHS